MPGLPKFKDFLQGLKDDPKGTIMYVAFLGIIVLFGIIQAGNKKSSARQDKELENCRSASISNAYTAKVENDQLRDKMVEVLGALKEVQGEMNTLRKLGIIK